MKIFFNKLNKQNFECSYLFPNEIESFLSEKENSKTIKAIHVNKRKLLKHFDNLLDILRDSNYSFNILCITETWCTDSTLKRIIQICISHTLTLFHKKKNKQAWRWCVNLHTQKPEM